MFAWQFCKALYVADRHGWTRFVSMQDHYNLLYREEEREMLALCDAEGIGVLPWSPLARGRLAREWHPSRAPSVRNATSSARRSTPNRGGRPQGGRARGEIAVTRGVPRARVALAWLLQKPAVTAPIVGATRPEHLEDAVASLGFRLAPDEVTKLEEPYVAHPVVGFH